MTARPGALVLAALVLASAATAVAPAVASGDVATPTPAAGDPPEGHIDHEGERLALTAGPAQAITGQVDLPPGTEVTVTVRSTARGDAFVRSPTVTVDRDGGFYALFDFSGVSPGTPATVSVRNGARTIARVNATVEACTAHCGTTERDDPAASGEPDVPTRTTGTAGRPVLVEVALGDADTVAVSFGSERVNYRLNATVRDGNGDGVVTVAVDTSAEGDDPSVDAVRSADSVTPTAEMDLPARATRLDAGEYGVSLYRGPTTDGEAVDVGTVVLREPDTPGWNGSRTTAEPGVGFRDQAYSAPAGATVTVPVAVSDGATATVVVGASEGGYEAEIEVTDGDGDGRVTLQLATTVTDGRTDATTIGGSDTATVERVTVPADARTNGTLAVGDYMLHFHNASTTDGDPVSVGTLFVEEPRRTVVDGDERATDGAGGSRDLLGPVALGVGGLLAAGGVGLLLGVRR